MKPFVGDGHRSGHEALSLPLGERDRDLLSVGAAFVPVEQEAPPRVGMQRASSVEDGRSTTGAVSEDQRYLDPTIGQVTQSP
jgi:hypothetical protein